MLFTGLCRYFGRANTRGEASPRRARGGSSPRPCCPLPEFNAGRDVDSPAAVPQLCSIPLVPTDFAATRGKALPQSVSVLLSDWVGSCDTLLPLDGYGSSLVMFLGNQNE